MMGKCPGRQMPQRLESVLIPCPTCKRVAELFTDEVRYRCRCGCVITRETLPSCAQWCAAAPQCLGKIVDAHAWEQKMNELRDRSRARLARKMEQAQPPPKKKDDESH